MFNVIMLLSIGCVAGYLLHDKINMLLNKIKGMFQ